MVSFDKKGNSFAAELIGNQVTYDNVSFNIGKHEVKNVLKCKGDTIQLPKEAAGKKLYILATSTDKDRQATFVVGDQSYELEVPYYSGFYGQWGHKGVSDGYIRNATPAYIGSHRHTEKGNDTYIYTYMYKFGIDFRKKHKRSYFRRMIISLYLPLHCPTIIWIDVSAANESAHYH